MQAAKSNQNPTLKAYEKRVKEDIRLIYDNLNDMLKLLRSDDEPGLSKLSQTDIDTYEFQIRTSNIIKASESLTKIISDLKDLIILNDFKSINSQLTSQCNYFKQKEDDIDRTLTNLKDSLIPILNECQTEYYTSSYK